MNRKNIARANGLTVNTNKTKILIFFSASSTSIPTFTYNDVPFEVVTELKYLSVLLNRTGKMGNARDQMACTFMRAVASVCTSGAKLGITNRKHARLWLFQNFALSAGLYGCQVWSTNKFSWHTSTKT